MSFSKTLSALRRQKGLSQTQAAAYLTERGFPLTQKGLSKWECGDTTPNAEQFLHLCALYGVRDVLSVFLHDQGDEERLNALGQSRAAEYMRLLLSDEAFCRREEAALPLFDMDAAYVLSDIAAAHTDASIPASESPTGAAMGLIVRGESMTPLFEDGQTVFLQVCKGLMPGDFGAFWLNGRLMCKLYMAAVATELVSVNEKFPPLRVSEQDDFHIIGKVIL